MLDSTALCVEIQKKCRGKNPTIQSVVPVSESGRSGSLFAEYLEIWEWRKLSLFHCVTLVILTDYQFSDTLLTMVGMEEL